MIPGLAGAEFLRFGSIHRNTYVNAPASLGAGTARCATMRRSSSPASSPASRVTPRAAATGLLAGINLARVLAGVAPVIPPPTTMLGALYRYLAREPTRRTSSR